MTGYKFIPFFPAALLAAAMLAAAPRAGAGDDLTSAAAALDDELYDLAEQNLRQYLGTNQPPGEAVILLARALHGQHRAAEMLDWLNRSAPAAAAAGLADQFCFWRALALYENARYAQALEQVRDFESRYPASALAADVGRVRAKALLKLGRATEAIAILEKLVKAGAAGPEAAHDRLALGWIFAQTGRTREAGAILEKLLTYPPESSIGQQGRAALGRVYLDEKQLSQARAIYETLAGQKNIPAEYRLQAVAALAEIAVARTNYSEALGLLEKGPEGAADPAQKNEFLRRKGLLLLKMKKIDEGIALIHHYVGAQTNQLAAAPVQLQLAQTLLAEDLNEKALAEFQNCLETFNAPPDLLAAYQGKGAALFNLARYHEAAAAFARAEEISPRPEEKNQCRWRAADSLFAAGQFQKAAEIYARITDSPADSALGRRALLQTAECQLQAGELAAAENALWKIYDDDPADELGPRALLRLADLLLQRNEPLQARSIYAWVNRDYGPQLGAGAIYGLGLIASRAGDYDEARQHFEQALKLSRDEETAAAAAYMSGWALFQQNKTGEARARFATVVDVYSRSSRAPAALFRLAEFDYNARQYDSAEHLFRRLADKYPRAAPAADGLFWAGRAALNQNEFRRARDYFSSLIRRYPASPRRPEARYFQGAALCELGQFDAAILVFNEIIKQYADHDLAEAAAFKKADCFFALGADDPKRYEEALNAYQLILDQPERARATRLQARYKMGRSLEKMGKPNEAFAQYLAAVYAYLQNEDQRPAANLWFSRAAFNAAGIMEAQQAWRKAANIYERVVEADIPASRDAEERLEKLRAEHWLSFY